MNLSQMNLGQRIAQAVRDFEQLRTHHGREWIAVLLNEETVVIAVHGCLTASENALAGSSAGRDQIAESQQRRFANTDLLRRIEHICGMRVFDTTVEVEPTTGGVVLLFTTDTAGKDFPMYPGRRSRTRIPGPGPLEILNGASPCATKTTGYLIRM